MRNVALVGLGWWGRMMLRMAGESGKLRIVSAIDPNPASEALAREHGVPHAAELGAALADPSVKAVILCTPHSLHARQIVAAAAAGKHVFCEKPLCLTRVDAARAIEACRAAGLVLGIGHERRFEPPILELRRMVEAGALGTLLRIEANLSRDKLL